MVALEHVAERAPPLVSRRSLSDTGFDGVSIVRSGVEIGRGGQGVIYRLPDGKVAKVFSNGAPDCRLEHEFRAASAARSCGVPTWTVERFSVEGSERFILGSFEPGVRLTAVLRRRPHAAIGMMRSLAAVHAGIHRVPFETRRRWRGWVGGGDAEMLRPFLSAPAVARLREILMGSESGFGHGDLAPRNVLCQGGRLVVLDWGRSGRGPMAADAGQTCMIVMSAPFGLLTPARLQRRYRRALVDAYVSGYAAASGRSALEVRVWAAIALLRKAAKLPPGRRKSQVEIEAARWARGLA